MRKLREGEEANKLTTPVGDLGGRLGRKET